MSVDGVVALAKGGPWDFYHFIPTSVDVRDVALAHIRAIENLAAEVSLHTLQTTLTLGKEKCSFQPLHSRIAKPA